MVVPGTGASAVFKLTFAPPTLSSPPEEPSAPAPASASVTAPSDMTGPADPIEIPTLSLTDPPTAVVSGALPADASPPAPADPLVALPTRRQPAGGSGGGLDWAQLGRLVLLSVVFGVGVAAARRALLVLQPGARTASVIAALRSRRGAA
jgi:hypothetical protein